MEEQHARLTVLIDADKKRAFDELCAALGTTSSAVVRELIRGFLDGGGTDPDRPAGAQPRRGDGRLRRNELQ